MTEPLAYLLSRRMPRRQVLGAVVGGSVGAALLACGNGGNEAATEPPASDTGRQSEPGAGPAGGTVPASLVWHELTPSGERPGARKDHSLAYDAGNGAAYVFGGRAGGTPLADLWAYDLAKNGWRKIDPAGGPSARFGHNAVFDAARRRLVIFGGQAGSSFFQDVWAFEVGEGRWRQLSAQGGPAQRYGAGGALDPAGAFYVTHGFTSQGRFDDTWRFNLADSAWKDASPGGQKPLPRCLLRSVWDEEGKSLLLFGGQSNSAPYHDDFWRLDPAGGAWRQLTATPKPSARNLYAAAWDTAGKRLLLLGGSTSAGNAGNLWAFDGERWTELAPGAGPAARNGHDVAYASDQRALLLFGGRGDAGELNDLWRLELA